VRATRDYIEKNNFPGVLLGLSGAVDSALSLAIAVDALGPRRVTSVAMPSRYTAALSNDEAANQARLLGVEHLVLPIEPPFVAFNDVLEPGFEGRAPDITEENLQSRCRGVQLMALSNKLGRMVLSTGNKSEMAVGYATIYGDMCGGFAPLKDCYKTMVYALCRHRNAISPAIPEAVIERAPSAELRENQTDQDSLPPYDVLDAILERFIENDCSTQALIDSGFERATVERVVRMVLRNEYKRRQAAPGPRVTRRAFGRDRRYPISSGWRGA
jgi:NAD+ synthase (glutamine-hydrolysing)